MLLRNGSSSCDLRLQGSCHFLALSNPPTYQNARCQVMEQNFLWKVKGISNFLLPEFFIGDKTRVFITVSVIER